MKGLEAEWDLELSGSDIRDWGARATYIQEICPLGQKTLKVVFNFLTNQGRANKNNFETPSDTCQIG